MKLIEFFQIFRMYKRMHGFKYSLTRAYEITFKGVAF